MTTHTETKREATIDPLIFWPTVGIVLVAVAAMIMFESQAKVLIDQIFSFVTKQFGFVYQWAGVAALAAVLWLGFGRYSGVRLGGPDAKPEFRRLSWIAMFFCSGIGTSLIYWAAIEWTYYYTSPPFGLVANSQAAAEYAAMYGMFHWGPIGWALYLLCAFPIGYAYYNRGKPSLRLSSGCEGVIGARHANGLVGRIIDVMMIVGLIGGTGTSLAAGTPLLSEALSQYLGVARSPTMDLVVVSIWTALFVTSVTLGLKRGIKVLSDMNIVAILALCGLILVFGPTTFMLLTFTDSMGLMMSEFPRLALYTDSIGKSGFPQDWTVFYFAWWVAYGPYMGIFIARISRGRTFRELTTGVILGGSGGCALFFTLFGNWGMHSELNGVFPLLETIKASGEAAGVIGLLKTLPFQWLVMPLFIFLAFVYSATTVDSSAYSIAIVASKNSHTGEPSVGNRMFWAVSLGVIAIVLMKLGGLAPLKTASLVVGVPLIFLMGISFFSLKRWLVEDYQSNPLVKSDAAKLEGASAEAVA